VQPNKTCALQILEQRAPTRATHSAPFKGDQQPEPIDNEQIALHSRDRPGITTTVESSHPTHSAAGAEVAKVVGLVAGEVAGKSDSAQNDNAQSVIEPH